MGEELGVKKSLFTYSIGRCALYLAMTETREQELTWKEIINNQGYRCVATEASGSLNNILNNIVKNAVTASIRTAIIESDAKDIHAVNHAILEAMSGVIPTSLAPNPNLKLKIAVVSDADWIAVGIYGYSALHYLTNQERSGLGIMHRG